MELFGISFSNSFFLKRDTRGIVRNVLRNIPPKRNTLAKVQIYDFTTRYGSLLRGNTTTALTSILTWIFFSHLLSIQYFRSSRASFYNKNIFTRTQEIFTLSLFNAWSNVRKDCEKLRGLILYRQVVRLSNELAKKCYFSTGSYNLSSRR